MIIYRSFKDCHFSEIKNNFVPSEHVYGKGFCYGLEESVSKEYSSNFKMFYYLLEYELPTDGLTKIDAAQFHNSDDLLYACFYAIKYSVTGNEIYLDRMEKRINELGFDLNCDLSEISNLFAQKGMFDSDISAEKFGIPDSDDYFEEFGYFFILNNKVIWTKKLEEMYNDSGIVVENYQDAQIVIYNKEMIKPALKKIRLILNIDLFDFYEILMNKYKIEKDENDEVSINSELAEAIDTDLKSFCYAEII
jgi:hypothetical protein